MKISVFSVMLALLLLSPVMADKVGDAPLETSKVLKSFLDSTVKVDGLEDVPSQKALYRKETPDVEKGASALWRYNMGRMALSGNPSRFKAPRFHFSDREMTGRDPFWIQAPQMTVKRFLQITDSFFGKKESQGIKRALGQYKLKDSDQIDLSFHAQSGNVIPRSTDFLQFAPHYLMHPDAPVKDFSKSSTADWAVFYGGRDGLGSATEQAFGKVNQDVTTTIDSSDPHLTHLNTSSMYTGMPENPDYGNSTEALSVLKYKDITGKSRIDVTYHWLLKSFEFGKVREAVEANNTLNGILRTLESTTTGLSGLINHAKVFANLDNNQVSEPEVSGGKKKVDAGVLEQVAADKKAQAAAQKAQATALKDQAQSKKQEEKRAADALKKAQAEVKKAEDEVKKANAAKIALAKKEAAALKKREVEDKKAAAARISQAEKALKQEIAARQKKVAKLMQELSRGVKKSENSLKKSSSNLAKLIKQEDAILKKANLLSSQKAQASKAASDLNAAANAALKKSPASLVAATDAASKKAAKALILAAKKAKDAAKKASQNLAKITKQEEGILKKASVLASQKAEAAKQVTSSQAELEKWKEAVKEAQAMILPKP